MRLRNSFLPDWSRPLVNNFYNYVSMTLLPGIHVLWYHPDFLRNLLCKTFLKVIADGRYSSLPCFSRLYWFSLPSFVYPIGHIKFQSSFLTNCYSVCSDSFNGFACKFDMKLRFNIIFPNSSIILNFPGYSNTSSWYFTSSKLYQNVFLELTDSQPSFTSDTVLFSNIIYYSLFCSDPVGKRPL